jgi:hypothetical protein
VSTMLIVPEIILFEHANLRGAHIHVFEEEALLQESGFNDRMSSFVIISGLWQFYRNANFDDPVPFGTTYGPGIYRSLPPGINNDDVSSLRALVR